MLAPLQKQCRVQFSEENYKLHEVNPETSFSRIITGNDIQILHSNPEIKQSPCNGNIMVHPLPTITVDYDYASEFENGHQGEMRESDK